MSDASKRHNEAPAKPPVRDSGSGEGVRGNREVRPGATPSQQEERVDVDALQAERDQLFDRLQRLAAEFDNYRKRNARENAALAERANERLVKELIPVLDDLARALDAAAEHEEAAQRPVRDSGPGEGVGGNREVPPTARDLFEGVRLVHRSLSDLLGKEGLAEIDTNGKFDPHVHEALLSQPSDREEGSVIEVVQKGYKLGDKVLRPARVVVAGPRIEEA